MSIKNIDKIKEAVKNKAEIKEINNTITIDVYDIEDKIVLPVSVNKLSRHANGRFTFEDDEGITYLIQNAKIGQVLIVANTEDQQGKSLDELSRPPSAANITENPAQIAADQSTNTTIDLANTDPVFSNGKKVLAGVAAVAIGTGVIIASTKKNKNDNEKNKNITPSEEKSNVVAEKNEENQETQNNVLAKNENGAAASNKKGENTESTDGKGTINLTGVKLISGSKVHIKAGGKVLISDDSSIQAKEGIEIQEGNKEVFKSASETLLQGFSSAKNNSQKIDNSFSAENVCPLFPNIEVQPTDSFAG